MKCWNNICFQEVCKADFLNVGLRNGNEVETENGIAWARFNGITTKTEVSFYTENLKINIDI